jgi:hypothetical protein
MEHMDREHVEVSRNERTKKVSRREALGLLGATGAALSLANCGGSPTSPSTTEQTTTTTTGTNSTCAVAPSETVGPYPS